MEELEIKKVKSWDVIQKYCSNKNLVSYILMMIPRRPGVMLFSALLEHKYFPPRTPKNKQFIVHITKWHDITYIIVSIPKKKHPYAKGVAKYTGNTIINSFPVLFEDGDIYKFPVFGNNVYTLENEHGHPLYKGITAKDQMLHIEDQILEDIIDSKAAKKWVQEQKDKRR